MPRTTVELVQGIIEVDDTIGLDPFILTANQLVTECCVAAGYADERLELIERWLAAHFYAIRDLRVAQEQAGPVNESFQYRVGLNLNVTVFGQQALALDTAGTLAILSKRTEEGKGVPKVGVTWAGKDRDYYGYYQ